jgi:hypothetical protein
MAFADTQANAVVTPVGDEGLSSVILAGAVNKGDGVGFSGGWKAALATVGGIIPLRCVALEDGVAGQRIAVCFGECEISGGRFTGGTAGGALYVAISTLVGQYTQTQPAATNLRNVQGYMLSATEALVTPNYNIDLIA